MKFKLRVTCPGDAIQMLSQDKEVADAFDLSFGPIETDSEDAILDRILDITQNSSGLWFNPIMTFTKKEIDKARFFQLECRKTVHETDRDYELNSSRLAKRPFIHTTDQCKIKLIDEVALSRIKLKPNMVAGVDEWTAEFIITSTVAGCFEKEKLSGLALKPVLNPKTGAYHDEFHMLYTESIMPPVEYDRTIQRLEKEIHEEGGFRNLGCLTYDFEKTVPDADFNRTSENFSSNFMPIWVVSARVRECFARNKLRGWAFRPVLEKGSKLQSTYLEKWQSLFERISINPQNIF